MNVAKAGAYKSAPEMFTNSAPSEDALTAQRFWLNDEWAQLSSAMETGRGLSQGYLKTWMDNYLDNLRRAGGRRPDGKGDGACERHCKLE